MTERNAKRRNAVIAAAAGAALLIGGSTYALWSASGNVTGGTITAGNLDLTVDQSRAYDVSADRDDSTVAPVQITEGTTLTLATGETGSVTNLNNTAGAISGHPIDKLADWRIVPGDTVAVAIPMDVTLVGDNLVADLTMDTTGLEASDLGNAKMTLQYALFDSNGKQIGQVQTLAINEKSELIARLQANGTGQDDGVDDTVAGTTIPVVETDGTSVMTLVVFGNFDETATDQKLTADALGEIPVTLTQVRTGTEQFVAPSSGTGETGQ